jgi:hypothetical protein
VSRENRNSRRENCPSTTLSSKNPTRTGLTSRHGERPRPNRLGLGNNAPYSSSFSLWSFRRTSARRRESSLKKKYISHIKEIHSKLQFAHLNYVFIAWTIFNSAAIPCHVWVTNVRLNETSIMKFIEFRNTELDICTIQNNSFISNFSASTQNNYYNRRY